MDLGHIPDLAHGMILQMSWAPGAPSVRKFFGGIKYSKKQNVPILAYRCSRCGFIELYAGEP